jgi:hypothetical protein
MVKGQATTQTCWINSATSAYRYPRHQHARWGLSAVIRRTARASGPAAIRSDCKGPATVCPLSLLSLHSDCCNTHSDAATHSATAATHTATAATHTATAVTHTATAATHTATAATHSDCSCNTHSDCCKTHDDCCNRATGRQVEQNSILLHQLQFPLKSDSISATIRYCSTSVCRQARYHGCPSHPHTSKALARSCPAPLLNNPFE